MRYPFSYIPAFFFAILISGANCVQAAPTNLVKVTAAKSVATTPHKPFTLDISLTIEKPYHIQANPPKQDYVATVVQVGPVPGLQVGKITYPAATQAQIGGETIPVYEGTVSVKAQIVAAHAGIYKVPITVKYQACNDKFCYPPTSVKTDVLLTVAFAIKSRK